MTLVVKVGGAAGNDAGPTLDDLAHRTDCVLVHGGSEEADELARQMGRPSSTYTSPSGVISRRTDAPQLEVIVLALAGKVQTSWVAGLRRRGAKAVGLSGVDGGLIRARRKEGPRAVEGGRIIRIHDDQAGTVEGADPTVLRLLLDGGFVPLVGPPALTDAGEIVNVDADRVAAAIAVALGASDLVLLTNVPGLLRVPTDQTTVIREVRKDQIAAVLPLAQGRMKKKMLAAQEALGGGVQRVIIAPSGRSDPVERALAGDGTVIQ